MHEFCSTQVKAMMDILTTRTSISRQTAIAVEILQKYYLDEDHVLVFDNSTTHLKRPEGALSALRMTKGSSANFMVEVNEVAQDGKLQYSADGKVLKKKVPMAHGEQKVSNGEEQAFYYPNDPSHPHAGQFKGMAVILEECGFKDAQRLKTQCKKKFADCPPGRTNCCCHRILFNKPNFVAVKSILEAEVWEKGFNVLFLLEFHCELNFIEQCWGAVKRAY